MFRVMRHWGYFSRLNYRHRVPPPPNDGDPNLLGPYDVRGEEFFWQWNDSEEKWQVVSEEPDPDPERHYRRTGIIQLANEQRGSMPPDKLVALLIQAAIKTEFTSRYDILEIVRRACLHPESLEFYDGFDDELLGRVLNRHRGRFPSRHLWFVKNKRYRLHEDGVLLNQVTGESAPQATADF